jgi:hypothetical protein
MANSRSAGLGKITALLLTAAMMVGTGIFTTLGEATTEARSGILAAMLLGVLIALMTGVSSSGRCKLSGGRWSVHLDAYFWLSYDQFHCRDFILNKGNCRP